MVQKLGVAKGDGKLKIRIVIQMKVDNLIVWNLNSRKVTLEKYKNDNIISTHIDMN